MSKDENKCKIWVLISTQGQYHSGDSTFVAWWFHKPSMAVLEAQYNPRGHSPTKSLLSDLWAGKTVPIGIDMYTLQQVPEGFTSN